MNRQGFSSLSVITRMAITSPSFLSLRPSQLRIPPPPTASNNKPMSAKLRSSSSTAAFTDINSTEHVGSGGTENEVSTMTDISLACPICYNPFTLDPHTSLSLDSVLGLSLECRTCKKCYPGDKSSHLDLIASSGMKSYGESMPASTEIFRLPLVSFLYERGWRQSFNIWGGFLGPEKEFELMKDYLKPVFSGNIVDASCGSGLFSRLFAKSGLFSHVVALDYSENMLQQCYEFIQQEENFPKQKHVLYRNLILVRADIARLPFVTSSVDAVHAGAALHCWPSPSAAVAEISRVLRPGGVFVATTYLLDGPYSFIPFLRTIRENIIQVSGSRIFLSERELEDLCRSCGFVNFTCLRNGPFIMIAATKPS